MTKRIQTLDAHLYKIVDTVSGKFYIGKHGGRIQQNYWGSGTRIRRHIKKYGKENMRYEILVIGSEDYILEVEKKYVTDEFIKENKNCLNLCKGGLGGNLGNVPWNKGLVLPEISKMMSKIHKGNTYRRGIKHSSDSIEKMRSSHKTRTRVITDEGREKIRQTHLGTKQPLSTCPVCNETGGTRTLKRWHYENCRHKEQTSWLV